MDQHVALKRAKVLAEFEGRLEEVECELAWRLGRLQSYSDEAIAAQLAREGE